MRYIVLGNPQKYYKDLYSKAFGSLTQSVGSSGHPVTSCFNLQDGSSQLLSTVPQQQGQPFHPATTSSFLNSSATGITNRKSLEPIMGTEECFPSTSYSVLPEEPISVKESQLDVLMDDAAGLDNHANSRGIPSFTLHPDSTGHADNVLKTMPELGDIFIDSDSFLDNHGSLCADGPPKADNFSTFNGAAASKKNIKSPADRVHNHRTKHSEDHKVYPEKEVPNSSPAMSCDPDFDLGFSPSLFSQTQDVFQESPKPGSVQIASDKEGLPQWSSQTSDISNLDLSLKDNEEDPLSQLEGPIERSHYRAPEDPGHPVNKQIMDPVFANTRASVHSGIFAKRQCHPRNVSVEETPKHTTTDSSCVSGTTGTNQEIKTVTDVYGQSRRNKFVGLPGLQRIVDLGTKFNSSNADSLSGEESLSPVLHRVQPAKAKETLSLSKHLQEIRNR